MDDLARQSGQSFEGPALTKLAVVEYRSPESGPTSLKVRLETPSAWQLNAMRPRRGAIPNAMNFGGLWIDTPRATPAHQFQLSDANGKLLRSTSTSYSSVTDDGLRVVQEMELTFRKDPELGPPTKLVVMGPKSVTVEVPFRLANVPLP